MSRQDGPQLVMVHGMEYAGEEQDSLKYPVYDHQYMQPPAVSPNPKSSSTITSSHEFHQSRKSDLPFEMRTWVFAMLAVLLGALIGGSIVGGVLGSMLVNRPPLSVLPAANDSTVATTPQASPTPESTTKDPTTNTSSSSSQPSSSQQSAKLLVDYVGPSRTQIQTLMLPCPDMHQDRYRSFNDRRFDLQCYINNYGMGTNGYDMVDITAIMAYRWQDCFDACASHNKLQSGLPSHLICRSVVYTADPNLGPITLQGGNCFLKNSTRHASNPGVGNGLNVFSADLDLIAGEAV
ncbi:hypothetical protein MCOR25_005039 [Pyricularia grisea]|nr:hypothetical protein MCOR25_005039 [Pyricularia grisea]